MKRILDWKVSTDALMVLARLSRNAQCDMKCPPMCEIGIKPSIVV